jgi:hypothetical protein
MQATYSEKCTGAACAADGAGEAPGRIVNRHQGRGRVIGDHAHGGGGAWAALQLTNVRNRAVAPDGLRAWRLHLGRKKEGKNVPG